MIGVIADDLTGAAELGGLATRLGLRATLLLSGSQELLSDVVCIDTDSRMCSPGEAARRAATAALQLKQAGATWIYKKVDSVLRGQVISEIASILEQLKLKLALLGPANPSLGRTIREGHYFVSNRPLHQTEFARDPAYPRTTSDVLKLLGNTRLPLHCCRPEAALPARGIVVAEAESSADVVDWAARWVPEILPAGGAEFFGELLKRVHSLRSTVRSPESDVADLRFEISESKGQEGEVSSSKLRAPKKAFAGGQTLNSEFQTELFVCGSMSESTREFVREAARSKEAAVFSLPEEIARGAEFDAATCELLAKQAAEAFAENKRVILQIGLPPVRDAVLAARLAGELVKLAEAVLRQSTPARVYAEGGATAVELARGMGWGRFWVVQELAPGVVALAPREQSGQELVIKPGSYRWPAAVVKGRVSNEVQRAKTK